jgi:hypothetical protein
MLELTERELVLIQDQEFLLAKARASAKIYNLLSKTRQELKKLIEKSSLTNEQKSAFKTHKISRGENYMGLPYQVLDYPAIFSQKDTFCLSHYVLVGKFLQRNTPSGRAVSGAFQEANPAESGRAG